MCVLQCLFQKPMRNSNCEVSSLRCERDTRKVHKSMPMTTIHACRRCPSVLYLASPSTSSRGRCLCAWPFRRANEMRCRVRDPCDICR